MALKNLEAKAEELISLGFAYCEEELRQSRLAPSHMAESRNKALAAAVLSAQESIKAFLAVARIDNE